jgi:hypothetical protein
MRRAIAGTSQVALLALLAAAGCGSGSNGEAGSNAPIASTPLAGKIGGQSWSLGTAETDALLSVGGSFFLIMYPETFTACSAQPSDPNENQFLPTIPMVAGDYALSKDLPASFQVGNTANVAVSGHLVIDSVTATTVTGGINATFDSNNTLDGQFTIAVCP